VSTADVDRRWLWRFHPSPDARVTLICLPHAGGSASFFFPVSAALTPDVDVLAVQYPGRQDRRHERCIDNIPELAERVFDVLPAGDGPIALFGHSMGALLGFELARMIEKAARGRLVHLFVSGRRAPSRPREEYNYLLSDDDLIAQIRALNGTDSRVLDDDELVRLALPAIRADYRAAETYVYRQGAPLSCPITVFAGRDDPKATVEESQAWSEHTTGDFRIHVYPGGHFFLIPHRQPILDIISLALTKG